MNIPFFGTPNTAIAVRQRVHGGCENHICLHTMSVSGALKDISLLCNMFKQILLWNKRDIFNRKCIISKKEQCGINLIDITSKIEALTVSWKTK